MFIDYLTPSLQPLQDELKNLQSQFDNLDCYGSGKESVGTENL